MYFEQLFKNLVVFKKLDTNQQKFCQYKSYFRLRINKAFTKQNVEAIRSQTCPQFHKILGHPRLGETLHHILSRLFFL